MRLMYTWQIRAGHLSGHELIDGPNLATLVKSLEVLTFACLQNRRQKCCDVTKFYSL